MRIDIAPDDLKSRSTPTKIRRAQPSGGPSAKKIKVAKKSRDSHYDELLQSSYDAAVISDLRGNIVDVNIRATDFLQYGRDDMIGASVLDVISGADDQLISQLCENVENERFTLIHAHCIRSDGTLFPCEIAVTHLELDEVCLCFFIRDITIRRQQEEMLLTEHNAIHNAGSGIGIANQEGVLEYVNPACLNLWGYADADGMLGRPVTDFWVSPDEAGAMVHSVLKENHSWTGEMKAIRSDGEQKDVQVTASPNIDPDGELLGIVFSFVDISDRRLAEDAMRQTERHRVMLESLGAACHHLGQPATVILANLGIIERLAEESNQPLRDLVGVSIEAAETLAEVLHKLNTVNEYRTTQYLERDGEETEDNRILEI
jgi:PAS domain S-box-containing protein